MDNEYIADKLKTAHHEMLYLELNNKNIHCKEDILGNRIFIGKNLVKNQDVLEFVRKSWMISEIKTIEEQIM